MTRVERTEIERLVSALRGKCAFVVTCGKDERPRSVAIKLRKGQMNVYEGGLDGTLSVTIDHMNAVKAEHVLEMLGIEGVGDGR